MKKIIFLIAIFMFVINPAISQTKAEKKAAKEAKELQEYEAMKKQINSEPFTFEADWATTQKGKRINLMSNPNYIKIDGKNTDAFLPYFGVAQVSSYNSNGGIEFKGEAENYTVSFNDKKKKATIKFKVKNDKSEQFNVTLDVFGSLRTSVTVFSNRRNNISYSGKITMQKK